MTLRDFVGKDEAKVAEQLILAAADDSAKAVKDEVKAHKKVWLAKDKMAREKLQTQAAVWATRHDGHRVECPACEATAHVSGEPVTAPVKRLNDEMITETQEYLPNQFECVACGLKITGLSRLAVAGLGDRYKKTQEYYAAEYYAPEDAFEGYEEDNNEPI